MPASAPRRPLTRRVLTLGAAASLGALLAATPAATFAQDFANEIRARQGQMRLQALNLGVLGAMARGNMPYDAETAQAAADNFVAIGTLDQRFHWPEGSSLFDVDNTRAMPEIWDDFDAFMAQWDRFDAAAAELQAVAGTGLEGLGAGLRTMGQSCGSCHESFQQSN